MVSALTVARGVAAGAGLALCWLAYRTTTARENPASSSFSLLLAALGVTALCAGATAHTGTVYKLVWLYTSLLIPLALAAFAFDYYGLAFFASRSRTRTALAPVAAGAAAGTLVVLGTPAMSAGDAAPVQSLASLPPLVYDAATTLNQVGIYYTTAVMLLAVGLVARTVYRYEHLDTRLGPVVAVVGVWPWLANLFVPQIAGAFGIGVGVATVASGYTASALLAAFAVGPLAAFESSPMAANVGPEVVLDSMEDAVIVVDDEGRVLRLNHVASETFATSEREAAGGPLTAVLDASLADLGGDDTVALDTTDGVRTFAVTRSTVTDRTGDDRGYALVLRDVTERRTREQRLDVFNRVLRHNLRNDANAIIGNARLVGDGGDDEAAADRIVDTTEDLVSLANRAREIERVLAAAGDSETSVRIAPVVESVVADVTDDYPALDASVDVPGDAAAAASEPVFEVVVRNLVENAAEHNDASQPRVDVTVDRTGDSIALAVADNGPGIPEQEHAVLDAGGEDQLQHGSSLGLWTVHWAVTRLGGALDFDASDDGTTVTVTVPAADSPAETTESGVDASA